VLVHLRGKVVRRSGARRGPQTAEGRERLALKVLGWILQDRRRFERAQRWARVAQRPYLQDGMIRSLPGDLAGWTVMRDLKPVAAQTFREWWVSRS